MGNSNEQRRRYLSDQVAADLARKMVLLGGPRQVGKTTIARQLLGGAPGYLSWDDPEDRERILRRELPATELVAFDELHKYRRWRNYLKALVDREPRPKILVTGSARLDLYRFGGDSLQGRYHYLRLHPLSVAELALSSVADLKEMLTLSGFPEPYFSGSQVQARRWSREYRVRLVREDVNALERVDDLGQLELLMLRLPELVGAPLSVNALREDLQLSHKTVARWLGIFENLYAIFRLPPFGAPRLRAVKKEQKHYHWDWSLIPDEALRFENLVASHLLKWTHHQQDTQGREVELRYFRDVDGREVDFVVVEGRKPLSFIECKWNDADIGRGLAYLKLRFPQAEAWQISAVGVRDYVRDGIRVCPALTFLQGLV